MKGSEQKLEQKCPARDVALPPTRRAGGDATAVALNQINVGIPNCYHPFQQAGTEKLFNHVSGFSHSSLLLFFSPTPHL